MQTRQPLALKSTNIQRSRSASPRKRSESPTKRSIYSTSPTKKQRYSPIKSHPHLAHPSSSSESPSPSLKSSFTIFQDATYDRHTPKSPNTKSIIPIFENTQISSNKENEFKESENTRLENKENPTVLKASNQNSVDPVKPTKRSPLSDLNINQYPGYIHLGPLQPLSQLQQLNEPWTTNTFSKTSNANKRILVPSYVTPPKRNRVHLYKYISNSSSATQTKNLLPKLQSLDDSCQPTSIDSFYVYNEKIDSL